MEENIKNARLEVRNLEHQKKIIGRCIGQLQQSLKNVQQEAGASSLAQGALLRLQATETLAELDSSFQKIQSAQSCSKLPPGVSSAICEMVQDTITDHNQCEKELKEELRRRIEAYNDMLVFMRHRLDELHVPHHAIKAKSIVYKQGEILADIEDEVSASEVAPDSKSTMLNQESGQAPVESKAGTNELVVSGVLNQESGQAPVESKAGTNELVVSGVSTGRPSEHENVALKGSSHPAGWANTYPSAKGSDNIHLGQVTLQRLTGS
ncbi:hypothetical protein EPH_0059910 [Eimeria praecox]|uniref:Uncharacterized protein n=1 Tax=Eimeria praecox TaxID=51316 RepID=U6GXF4_9EIME|nr:hypothetical protein EPH_0059910 [Eimeria praecox]